MKTEVRIDKWLWAVRLFKTRSLAAEACKKGKILMHGTEVKASRNVRVGDTVQIKRSPVLFSFKVLALAENRMGAALVPGFMSNVTTPDQLELYELDKINAMHNRQRGTGRPTKKERRDLDTFFDPVFTDDSELEFNPENM
jgi:ribosome-associated heat shock protein Hsp15